MASSFTWLDYSETEKRLALDFISQFGEQDTQDELGVGSIRDAFAEMFFPGTSTIQTRVRYFLFIPWIYQSLLKAKTKAKDFEPRLRHREIQLIEALTESNDRSGIIGQRARKNLKRLPSSIYWAGLETWGIRQFAGSQAMMHQSVDSLYKQQAQPFDETDMPIVSSIEQYWDAHLPPPPENFPNTASFALTQAEAQYLRDRISLGRDQTLLKFLVNQTDLSDASFPWEHLQFATFPGSIQTRLHHARRFSLLMQGAFLSYAWMLANRQANADLADRYEIQIDQWQRNIQSQQLDFYNWERHEFWQLLSVYKISGSTQSFANQWFDFALNLAAGNVITNPKIQQFIQTREYQLKGNRARLINPKALESWEGKGGSVALDYRWRTARRLTNDILTGLKED